MKFLFASAAVAFSTITASAHEFWIDPEEYMIEPGGTFEAALRVGTEYEGTSYAFFPESFVRFELAAGENAPSPYRGRIGDRPGIQTVLDDEGLATFIYVSRIYDLTWDTWEEFSDFVRHKDGRGIIEAHESNGYEKEAVREVYSRHAKTLVAVGQGAGEDTAHGLAIEIVALENPYTDDLSDGMDLQVFYLGEPRADEQIEIFARDAEQDVTISTARTDQDGRVTIDVSPNTEYLVDSVAFRSPADDLAPAFDPQWETLWASLTFKTPE